MSNLAGMRGGGGLRQAVRDAVPEEVHAGSPLYLILDDLAGASLVSGWAWSHWDPNWSATVLAALTGGAVDKHYKDRRGICAGFVSDSSAFDPQTNRSGTSTLDLRNSDDPDGWHVFPVSEGASFRRARRIDVWVDDLIHIDSAFQDSAATPDGGRSVVHEYSLSATADISSQELNSVEAVAHVLPFFECKDAAGNVARMIGVPLPVLRDKVLEILPGTAGCTHLNDALRALAEVPKLAERLRDHVER